MRPLKCTFIVLAALALCGFGWFGGAVWNIESDRVTMADNTHFIADELRATSSTLATAEVGALSVGSTTPAALVFGSVTITVGNRQATATIAGLDSTDPVFGTVFSGGGSRKLESIVPGTGTAIVRLDGATTVTTIVKLQAWED